MDPLSLPMVTADVVEIRVLPFWLRQFREKVFENTTLPIPGLKKEIEGGVKGFLAAQRTASKKKNILSLSVYLLGGKFEPGEKLRIFKDQEIVINYISLRV